MLRGLESLAQARNLSLRFDEATAIVDDLVDACVEIKFQAPHAIDATCAARFVVGACRSVVPRAFLPVWKSNFRRPTP